jgi:hypothetical protein
VIMFINILHRRWKTNTICLKTEITNIKFHFILFRFWYFWMYYCAFTCLLFLG